MNYRHTDTDISGLWGCYRIKKNIPRSVPCVCQILKKTDHSNKFSFWYDSTLSDMVQCCGVVDSVKNVPLFFKIMFKRKYNPEFDLEKFDEGDDA